MFFLSFSSRNAIFSLFLLLDIFFSFIPISCNNVAKSVALSDRLRLQIQGRVQNSGVGSESGLREGHKYFGALRPYSDPPGGNRNVFIFL